MGGRSTCMTHSATAYIGLGANLGDRLATLREAVRRLGDVGIVTGGLQMQRIIDDHLIGAANRTKEGTFAEKYLQTFSASPDRST